MNRSRTISLFLLAVGVLGFVWLGWAAITAPRSRLVETPVEIDEGGKKVVRFTPDASFDYMIKLLFRGDERQVVCSVGSGKAFPFDYYGCKGDSRFVVAWTLFGAQNILADKGVSTTYQSQVVATGYQKTVERVIGAFHGKSGITYTLVLSIHPGANALDKFAPVLVVESTQLSEQGQYVYPAVMLVSAMLLVLGFLGFRRSVPSLIRS